RPRGRLSGERVRPVGSLIDPALDDVDLRRVERTGRRHRRTVTADACDAHVEPARRAVPSDDRDGAAAHRIAAPIEPEPVLVDGRAVTAVAVLPEDRL